MRTPAWLMTAALVAVAIPLSMLPAVADDAATITACLEAERSKPGHDGHACIGRISKPCMQEPGGETTAGMKMCTARETEVWDAILNAEYQQLLASLQGKATEKIRKAQRSWIVMRDGDCALSYDAFQGGTIAGVIAGSCMLDHTATRALQLHELRTSNSFE